jgi:hypothetical protein
MAPVSLLAGSALGLLFARSATWFNLATVAPDLAPARTLTTSYVALAVTVAALLVWHRWPARGWPWLLLAGAVCALPDAVLWVAPSTFVPSLATVYGVLSMCAPTIAMIGTLGAATQLWHGDRRPAAAVLTGAAILVQVVGPTAVGALFALGPRAYGWTSLVLVAIALAGAAAAIARVTPVDQPSPTWRVTLLGAVGTAAPLLLFHWRPGADPAGYLRAVGAVLLVVGVAAGAAAGVRALRAAAGTGLLVGALSTLVLQATQHDLGVLTTVLAAAAVAAGGWATRAVPYLATTGLHALSIGLLATFVLYVAVGALTTADLFAAVLAPVLAALGVVAGTAAIGTTADTLAPHAEPPPVLAGIAIPLTLGTVALIGSLAASPPLGRIALAGIVPGALVAVLAATALLRPRLARPIEEHDQEGRDRTEQQGQ